LLVVGGRDSVLAISHMAVLVGNALEDFVIGQAGISVSNNPQQVKAVAWVYQRCVPMIRLGRQVTSTEQSPTWVSAIHSELSRVSSFPMT
jgi:hypothetical protein